jgi:hypothetical protein
MAETAAAAGVQVAASGAPGNPGQTFLGGGYQTTHDLLQSVMFGTTIDPPIVGQPCGSLGSIGDGHLQVCTYPDGALVAETIRGHPAFPIAWVAQHLPWTIDVTVEMHAVSYQP